MVRIESLKQIIWPTIAMSGVELGAYFMRLARQLVDETDALTKIDTESEDEKEIDYSTCIAGWHLPTLSALLLQCAVLIVAKEDAESMNVYIQSGSDDYYMEGIVDEDKPLLQQAKRIYDLCDQLTSLSETNKTDLLRELTKELVQFAYQYNNLQAKLHAHYLEIVR